MARVQREILEIIKKEVEGLRLKARGAGNPMLCKTNDGRKTIDATVWQSATVALLLPQLTFFLHSYLWAPDMLLTSLQQNDYFLISVHWSMENA